MTQPVVQDPQLESAKLQAEIAELRQKVRWFWLTPLAIAVPAILGLLSIWQGLQSQAKQQAFDRQQANVAFLEERLNKLYVPVTMHLAVVQGFFDRYPEAGDAERPFLEQEWREHNRAIRQLVTDGSAYITPAPRQTVACVDSMVLQLLVHLSQWDLVYRLKHEARTYKGPIYAGIREFGYRGFPQGPCGADSVFTAGLRDLRQKLHAARAVP
jgi:hypothetical protein